MCLEAKKQKAKKDRQILRITSRKQCTRDFFRGWNASKKVRLIYLELLKHKESYGWCFCWLNDIDKVTRDDFTGRKH